MPSRFFSVAVWCLSCWCVPSWATGSQTLQLFGQSLHGAHRDTLRHVFRLHGMRPVRIDDLHNSDVYDATNVLHGAAQFEASYAPGTQRFVRAQYTFPGYMKPELIGRVARLVERKYGPPSSQTGIYRMGNVRVTWHMPQGMEIEVRRGWPDTTTYLSFIDTTADKAVQATAKRPAQRPVAAKVSPLTQAF